MSNFKNAQSAYKVTLTDRSMGLPPQINKENVNYQYVNNSGSKG